MRTILLTLCAMTMLVSVSAQDQPYTGPIPAKADVPYLLHASTLIETQGSEAHEDAKKNETTYWVEGTSSTARTPLAEPIFIIRIEKLNPDKLELYKFNVTKTRRELTIKDRPGKNDRPLYVSVTKLGKDLYKIEASEVLANGEYSLSPSGSNRVFAFQVY
ncbi:MAG: hypothetical protein ABI811_04680 [Acidobacteriota bacterium]